MFSLTNLPSTSTLFSSYASLSGTIMLFRSLVSELVPHQLQNQLLSKIQYLFNPLGSQLTLVIEEFDGLTLNEVYEASELYLSTKISPSVERLRVVKLPREKNHAIKIDKGEEITDVYQGIQLKWKFISTETMKPDPDDWYAPQQKAQERSFELKFQKKHKEQVVGSYLSHVLTCAKMMKEENKVVKLYTIDRDGWHSINLEHPATFDTLGIDQKLKSEILEDLERFVRRREFYKSVGKAWKRGYLLYGPPGTGKSSLVAAIANHLKFDIYDMDLAQVFGNNDLRRQLVATTNRSIIVLEDIDCAADFKTDAIVMNPGRDDKITLSGLLNFIDGLWSSCGDERIIIFTTNHKDRLDPALLRPGRMDKHIHMSYCTRDGFNVLASNYLGIHDNKENRSELYLEIENLIEEIQVTPAEVAEELMKSEDAETALSGLLESLNRRKVELAQSEDNNADQELETTIPEAEDAKGITTRTGGVLKIRYVRGMRGRGRRF